MAEFDRYPEFVGEASCDYETSNLDENGDEIPCDFSGEVDKVADRGLIFWTCPKCGAEHEERD